MATNLYLKKQELYINVVVFINVVESTYVCIAQAYVDVVLLSYVLVNLKKET